MPDVTISGKKLPRIESVHFSMGLGGGDATQLPHVSCTIVIPADNDDTLTKWMLAPQSDDRFKKVEVKTYDRSGTLNKTWTFAKAYIAALSETETGGGQHTSTSFTVVGTLIHATENYDGKNIIEITAGEAEANPG